MQKKVAVILSGCGVRDGSEIHEAVCTLLSLAQEGIEGLIYAPDINQARVINHLTNKPTSEVRNVLVESARIARGKIKPLSELSIDAIDGIIFPGGMGAITNLCNFAEAGTNCDIDPQVERVIIEAYKNGKPIAGLCIAPVLIAIVLGRANVKGTVTIGNDRETARAIEEVGFIHKESSPTDCVVDPENKIITSPCYMLARSIAEVYQGIKRVIEELVKFL